MHASEVDLSQLNGHACRRLSCSQLLNIFFSYSTITVLVANGNLAVSSVRADTDLAHFQIVTYFMTNANLPPTVAKWVIAFNICPPPPQPLKIIKMSLLFKGKSHELCMCKPKCNTWKILQKHGGRKWWSLPWVPEVIFFLSNSWSTVYIILGILRTDLWS